MQQNLITRSSNNVKVLLDGKQVGLIQSVSMNDDYSPEPASGIGDIHVQEYVPTMARHSLSISNMALRVASLLSLGIVPKNGDAALQGLVFTFESYDKTDGTLLRTYKGCSYASGSLDISKHSILMRSGQFYALDVDGTGA